MPDSRGSKRNRPNPDDPESVLCKICFCILDLPVEFPCDNGHFFCAQCLYKNLKVEKNVTCPVCRKRAGAWARRISQQGKKDLFAAVKEHVDARLHEVIQTKYPRGEGSELLEERNDEVVHHLLAEPGEVAKEFREQLEQLREEEESVSRKCILALQAEEEEERKRRLTLEAADAQLAALMQKEESTEGNQGAAGPLSAKKDTKKSPFRGLRQISLKDCVNHLRGKSENKENSTPTDSGFSSRSTSVDNEVTEVYLRELFEACKEEGQDFETFVREQRSNFTEVEGAKSRVEQDRKLAAKVQEELNSKGKKTKVGPMDFFFRSHKQNRLSDPGTSAQAAAAGVPGTST